MLTTVDHAASLLAAGTSLIIAGDERLLRQLPRGAWIGGTIPYFMTETGGRSTRDEVFVVETPAVATTTSVTTYSGATIDRVAMDSPDNGYTVLILPAFTPIHQQFALDAPMYPNLFMKVVAGWIAGVHLDELATRRPVVVDGSTGEVHHDAGVALHVELPAAWRAQVEVVNIFERGSGPDLRFPTSGLDVGECLVDGQPRSFLGYLREQGLDVRLPLVADFCGTRTNVSIRSLDETTGLVRLYAPVFAGVSYRFASPVSDYPRDFAAAIRLAGPPPVFACNCVLNYLYGELEGRRTGSMTGPMTFGEIAYQLVNQTMVEIQLHAA